MNKKIGMLGDLHNGHVSVKNHPEVYDAIYKFVADKMIELGITELVQLGDIHDVRKSIEIGVMDHSIDLIKTYWDGQPFKTRIIAGNHDFYYKNSRSVSSLRALKQEEFKTIDILTEPAVEILFDEYSCLFEPWTTNAEDRQLFMSNLTQVEYVFCHVELPFISNDTSVESIDIDSFYGKEKVFAGHYHTPSVIDNFEYIGSALHLDWGDANSFRYFYVFDFETGEYEKFCLNHLFPNYVRLNYSNIDKRFFEFMQGCHLEIILGPEHFDKYEKIYKYFNEKFSPLSLNFIYERKEELLESTDAVKSDTSNEEIDTSILKVVGDLYIEHYANSEDESKAFTTYLEEVDEVKL